MGQVNTAGQNTLLHFFQCNVHDTVSIYRELEEDAAEDEDIADMLQGAAGDPNIIKQRASSEFLTQRQRPCSICALHARESSYCRSKLAWRANTSKL